MPCHVVITPAYDYSAVLYLGRRGREGGAEARRRREAGGLVRELAKEIAEESNPNPDSNPNPQPQPQP